MEAVGTVLSVCQTMFAALQCSELKQICSMFGYVSELEKLGETVSTIKAALLDAEAKQELSHQEIDWVEKLKDALYDADDLLDEFTTLAQRQRLLEGNEVSKKERVRSWFSTSPLKKMHDALNMSLGVRGIRKKFDAIASDYSKFGFKVDNEPIRRRREETCSYVDAKVVIGREDDKEGIVDLLLGPGYVVEKDVSFLPIVGVGGLGKTTLAQLVYNDERVRNEFLVRAWACVSDQDDERLDIKAVLCKILESAKPENPKKRDEYVLDVVQSEFRQLITGKKYLLVLDDIWSENPIEFRKLAGFFAGGQRGSWIVVTTRSKETSRIIGDAHMYELKGLSEENSWRLFEMAAVGEGKGQLNAELVEIGKNIVRKCAGVPLAIRVIGSLLHGQGKSMWLSFQINGLANIRKGNNDILPILKFSYYHLESSLKSCFSFCALFPKDFEMRKEMLIDIWMANGCIVPFHKGQSFDDAGEEHFSILLRRCFFQDIERDRFGEIFSCKVHDLMHDIAREVAGKDIYIADSITMSNLDEKTRHLFLTHGKCAEKIIGKTKLRTYLYGGSHILGKQNINVDAVLANWVHVRVLDLRCADIESLPETIGELVHLRYLDLSRNEHLEMLPQSFTKLYNLQTLILRDCFRLRELPKDLSKLVKIGVLDIVGCSELTYMPLGIDKLTCLHNLTRFVIGPPNSSSQQCVEQLEALRSLTNLKGSLGVDFLKIAACNTYEKEVVRKGGYLRGMQHLNVVAFWFDGDDDDITDEYAETFLEGLEPHPNLRELHLCGYNGSRISGWTVRKDRAFLLTNLVTLRLYDCCRFQYLPSLGKLPHLKQMELNGLELLESIENTNSDISQATSIAAAKHKIFFPSLEKLWLDSLPKLKGWWSIDVGLGDGQLNDNDGFSSCLQPPPSFPRLSQLKIHMCPNLTSIPLCPNLEDLELVGFNESLYPIMMKNNVGEENQNWMACSSLSSLSASASSSSSLLPSSNHCRNLRNFKLRIVKISNAEYLNSLPMEAFQCLSKMDICGDRKLENLSELGEVFRRCSSSLRSLSLNECSKLRSLRGGLEHLTALEFLLIDRTYNMDMVEEEGEDDGMITWRSLQYTLRSLVLKGLPKLAELPNGMHQLTSLQSLSICNCPNLKCLPQWGCYLSSLRSLTIRKCENLQGLPEWVCCSSSLRLEIE